MKNTLILLSDEHSRKVLGAYGNEQAQTPNLDALAARGTQFSNAYCNSPLCVPSRASLHTGKYVHQLRNWDNAMPYEGNSRSWAHALSDSGRPCVSIGKLHFRDAACDVGFDEQILALHVKDGIGDATSLLRRDPMKRSGSKALSQMTGKGISPYDAYDRSVTDAAIEWIKRNGDKSGWTLFVSLVMPHFPLNAPDKYRKRFDRNTLPRPKAAGTYQAENESLRKLRSVLDYQDYFDDDGLVQEAIAQYYALCSALDDNIGRVLAALDTTTQKDKTNVIYTSDHGDNLGNRGFWGKATMWEESVGIPLIIAGPDIPVGNISETAVSLLDLYPTILENANLNIESGRAGKSLIKIANEKDYDRSVMAEYHATGSPTGMFMLRRGDYKLIASVGDAPILYNLRTDPDELTNIANDPEYSGILSQYQQYLSEIVNTEMASNMAFSDQARRIEELGGEKIIRGMESIPFTDPRTM